MVRSWVAIEEYAIWHSLELIAPGDLDINKYFQATFRDCKLMYPLWNYAQMNVIDRTWLVNSGSGNGLVPSSSKPVTEPISTKNSVAIWRHQATMNSSQPDSSWSLRQLYVIMDLMCYQVSISTDSWELYNVLVRWPLDLMEDKWWIAQHHLVTAGCV